MGLARIGKGLTLVALAALTACVAENQAASTQDAAPKVKGGDDRSGPYDVVAGWWKPAPDHDTIWGWGSASGIWPDTPDRILAVIWGDSRRVSLPGGGGQNAGRNNPNERQRNFLVAVDRNGNITENWSQWDSIFNRPHQIYINPYDPERAVWVDERGGEGVHEAIYKFTNDGKQKLLDLRDPRVVAGETDDQGRMTPARENLNPGPLDFGQNAVLAFMPNGDFLVGDGYQNGRVIRFNSKGEFVSEFGSVDECVRPASVQPTKPAYCSSGDKSTHAPGQFDLIHGIAVDKNNRIFVSDRMNHRVQIFDEKGTPVDQWNNIWDPVAILIDVNDKVWVLDATLNRILRYNMQGELEDYFGTYGAASSLGRPGFTCADANDRAAAGMPDWTEGPCGGFALPHQMSIDSEGNVYVAQFGGPWFDKYVPRADADKSRLIGQPMKP